ncbi:hypothetical protein [Winogradskyella costae]|uniref:hypothetical protein n=1 Tax=Winogradskyella costae TaxID=2697008 RepID=UPI0015CE9756|nr:hypothetical protein [Winogradskyella costae]
MKIKNLNSFYYTSLILYLISLTQNAFYINNENENQGYLILIFGFYAIFGAGVSWLANILILFSWLFRHKKSSIYFSLSALILGISFLFFDKVVMGTNNKYEIITGYDIGYYCWILSFLVMFIGNILNYKKRFANTMYN